MNAHEFVMWMKGVHDLVGEKAPTQAQWDVIRNGLAETVGRMVAEKMYEKMDARYPSETKPYLNIGTGNPPKPMQAIYKSISAARASTAAIGEGLTPIFAAEKTA